MSKPLKGSPEPGPGGIPPDRPELEDRDATAVLTPAPRSNPSDTSPPDAATLVDLGPSSGPVGAADAPTIIDTGFSPPKRPQEFHPNQPMLSIGVVLGNRYEIVAQLGEGGMGAVYKAIDRELNRPVALKVIRPDLAQNPAIIERFKQELLLAREVTHRNVIRIYDLGEADRVKFITMEFVEGEDLRSLLLREKKLDPEQAVDIVQQICRALEAAHSTGIIHRDLKPQNVMCDKTGRILVMDFGLARTVEGRGMTQTGALVGTMDYMSPEQALGKSLDQRSDLYTVGLIFYELLTGKMPFAAESALASLIRRTQERATPVLDSDSSIPPSVSNIVSKCLERDLNLRYQTIGELLADLDAWQGNRAGVGLTFHANVGPWGRDINWPMIATFATVIILATAGWLLRGRLFEIGQRSAVVPQVSLAILPFRNASGDAGLNWMGGTVAEILRTDMGQSASFRTVPSDRLNQIFHDLRVAPDSSLDPETLRRVAEFTASDRLLWGQYVKLGDQIRIDATLQDLKRQRNFPLHAEAASEKELPGALQQLAQSVEKDLALPAETVKELQAKSFAPSSQSVQALRYYSEGVLLAREAKNLDALKQFEAATKEDPNFALAYSKLAVTYAALGYGDTAQQLSRKAIDLSDKASPQEQALIQAENARVASDYGKAIQAYEKLAQMLPNDSDIQYALARLYEDSGAFDKAHASYDKILARDPKNVDALLHMGWVEIRLDNAQGSLDYLSRALTLAVQLQNGEEKAAILDATGNAYHYLNQQDDALRNYSQALDIKRRLGNKGAIAESLNLIAQADAGIGKSDEAAKSYQESARLRREIGDNAGLGRTLLDFAVFNDNLGHYDAALSAAKQSLVLLREVGDHQNEATCLSDIGGIYLDKVDFENAITYLQQALVSRQQIGAPADIAESLNALGQVYTRMAQYDQATDYYLKALDVWRKAGDKRGEAFASYGLGRNFQYQGRYGAALKSEEDALKSWRATNERGIWLPQIQGEYGNSLGLLGRWDEAQKNLDDAVAASRELKNDSTLAQILNYKGDSFFYRGDTVNAKTFYEQASKAGANAKDQEQILSSKFNLAKITATGRNTPDVINSLTALIRNMDAAGLKQLSLECSTYLAAARIDAKNYAQARDLLEHSLAESEKLGLKTLLAKNHFLLAEAFRLSGNQADAVHHYSEAHRIIDDIHKEAQSDDIMKRVDLAKIYQQSARWQTSGM